jgi:large subunit ribosomal protein L25
MTITIQAEKRDSFGKNANRRLRMKGRVPAILYGGSVASVPLVLEKKDVVRILKTETRENTLFKVSFGDEMRDAMIRELQIDPVSDELIHADLVQIAMDKVIRVTVPIVPKGEAVGVKTEGGFVDFVTREIEVDCLPKNIPERIEIDISGLHLHQSVKVESVTPPEGVHFVSDPATVLVLISLPHKEEEFPGEKPEEVVAEEGKEPEVIKKERAAEEPEAEGKAKEKGKEKEKEKDKDKGKEKGKGKEK